MNNIQKKQNVFISDGTGLPANNTAISTSAIASGTVAVFGGDMTALNPAGGDTISTQPSIYVVEQKTTTAGTSYLKRSPRIDAESVIAYEGKSYIPAKREVWTIGYNRKTAAGTIEVNSSTEYSYRVRFKWDKVLYSGRPEELSVNFTSATSATQSNIADQIVSGINNSSYSTIISAVKIGNGTGAYGLTGASNYGVEIMAKDVNQFTVTNYSELLVYFSVHVDDSTGFGTTTTCTQIQAFSNGNGTFRQVRTSESKAFANEGVLNRRLFPIPELDYSSTSTLILSAAIGINQTGVTGEDTVTFASTIAAILRVGEKVEIDGVNYEIKYIMGDGTGVGAANAVVLTSPLTTTTAATNATKVRLKYDTIVIEFNDAVTGPTGVVAVANKSILIAVPAIATSGAYNALSTAGTNLKALLDGWLASTPRAFAAISI